MFVLETSRQESERSLDADPRNSNTDGGNYASSGPPDFPEATGEGQ